MSALLLSRPASGPALVRGSSTESQNGGRLLAAFEGSARWLDASLQQLAARSGHAAALLAAYGKLGTDVPSILGGPFAIAILDADLDMVLAASDRMGATRLYYAHSPAGVTISTSLAEVVENSQVPQVLDTQALYDYVYFHAVPAPRTVYRDVRTLRRAETLVIRQGRTNISRHWTPSWDATDLKRDAAADAIKQRLKVSVERCIPSGASTADCFLSGGLDSSSVAGICSEIMPPDRVRAFSIGFAEPEYDETRFASVAASTFKIRWHRHELTPDEVCASLPSVVASFDEPFGNSSALAVYHCAQVAASQGVQKLLAGDGGDEIFGGNYRYAKQLLFERYQHVPAALRRKVIEPITAATTSFRGPSMLRKAQSFVAQASVPLPDRLQSYNFLSRLQSGNVFTDSLIASINPEEPRQLQRGEFTRAGTRDPLNAMLYLDWQFTLHDNDLVKVNSMCRLAGLQVAYPMLDEDLVALGCSLPADWKVRNGELRWLYRRAMRDFLPDMIIDKTKHGFGLPFGIWTRTHSGLASLAQDALSSLKARRIFRPEFLDQALRMHREVHAAYYGELVWILMVLELWFQARMPRASL